MAISNLRQLMIEELKDLYDAEQRIGNWLEDAEEQANSHELKRVFSEHRTETRTHVARLKHAFEKLGEEAETKKCHATAGIIKEADDITGECDNAEVRDAALIASAQRIEHYEIAGYGVVRSYARLLGDEAVSELLNATLGEEKEDNARLAKIADGSSRYTSVNQAALAS